ncbi:hypothetical protein SPAN111604_02935 [Sphingomonas antarctica]|uniref:right-handed parallel beta-helix repeat-containing protein n=1 Tax=Sphingomonas antarctica TaxID=2040274 RepID=UPI0039EC652E
MKIVLAVAAYAAATMMSCAANAATVTVGTSAALDAAIKAASGGDIIRIAPGNYGDFEFRNVNPASAITITSANSARPPVFAHLTVRDSSFLNFSRLTVSSPAPTAANPALNATDLIHSHDVRFSAMIFQGVVGGGVANEARGMRISQSSGITVATSSFNELSHAITTDGSSHMTITDNAFSGIRTDGIIADGASASLIARNRFSAFRPEAGDHPDAIQVFNNLTPTSTLTITDNLMVGDDGGQMQGIFMTNNAGNRAQLDRINIIGNLMWGTMWNGIAAFDANRLTVTGNVLYSNADLDIGKTWVRLEDVSTATVSGNIAGAFIYADVGTLTGSANTLLVADVGALAAVGLWDATHAATRYAIAYDDTEVGSLAPEFAQSRASAFAVAGVPEPASWLTMITGFLMTGAVSRRLQRARGRRIQPA